MTPRTTSVCIYLLGLAGGPPPRRSPSNIETKGDLVLQTFDFCLLLYTFSYPLASLGTMLRDVSFSFWVSRTTSELTACQRGGGVGEPRFMEAARQPRVVHTTQQTRTVTIAPISLSALSLSV